MRWTLLLALLCICMAVSGCRTVEGDTVADKRANIEQMQSETLAELYKEKPSAQEEISNAAGYAVFSNIGLNLFIIASGNGFGMVTDNQTGNQTCRVTKL